MHLTCEQAKHSKQNEDLCASAHAAENHIDYQLLLSAGCWGIMQQKKETFQNDTIKIQKIMMSGLGMD